jgi:hypothetical protein
MMTQHKLQRAALAVALAGSGMIVGANFSPTNVAHGEIRGTPEPQAFQAGSVPILKEISGTLRQMDMRLARLEIVAQKLQTAAVRNAVKGAAADDTGETK